MTTASHKFACVKICRRLVGTLVVLLLAAATNVTSREITVVLLGGQSNASGRAPATNLPPDSADSSIEFFYDTDITGAGSPVNSGSQFVPLAPPGDTFGPEFTLARTLYHRHGLTNLTIVKRSKGATSLFDDWAVGGALYTSFVTNAQTALGLLTARGDTFRVLGLAWHQGESDGVNGRTSSQYRADLVNFMAHLRQDLHSRFPEAGFENLNWAIGEAARPEGSGISAAQSQVAALDSAAQFVSTADLTYLADNLHYDASSQLALGERLADALMAPETLSPAGRLLWTNADRGQLWHFFAPSNAPLVLRQSGDRFEATFQILVQEPPSGTAGNALRFGVYDSVGSRRLSHVPANSNSDSSFTNWTGFLATLAVNSTNDNASRLYRRTAGTNTNPCSTVSSVSAIGTTFSGDKLAAGQFHAAAISVEMGSGQLTISTRLGRSLLNQRTLAWSTGQSVSLDAFALLNTPATAVTNLQFDNFVFTHVTNETVALPPPASLRFSETMYAPAPPSATELAAGFTTDDFQFVELSHCGTHTADAAGLRLSRGLVLTVQGGSVPAGGTAVLVRNRAAFLARYPAVATNLILGEFLGDLADSETLQLVDAYGRILGELFYNADDDWPLVVPAGRSLVRKNPFAPPAPNNVSPAWRVSRDDGGNPGATDSVTFTAWLQSHAITNSQVEMPFAWPSLCCCCRCRPARAEAKHPAHRL